MCTDEKDDASMIEPNSADDKMKLIWKLADLRSKAFDKGFAFLCIFDSKLTG